jgi:hypothetical protein
MPGVVIAHLVQLLLPWTSKCSKELRSSVDPAATSASLDLCEIDIRSWPGFPLVRSFRTSDTPGTVEGDRFEILVMLVEAYEARHHPIAPPDPVEAQYGKMPD